MTLLNFLYPNKCPFCGHVISNSESYCSKCNSSLSHNDVARSFHLESSTFTCVAPYFYYGTVKKAIWKFKFRDHKAFALSFALAIDEALRKTSPDIDLDIVTSVPISKERLKQRGYNQTELFAKRLAKLHHVKYKCLLSKTVHNREQHSLPAKERIKNVQGVYSVKNPDILSGKKILLCDDIITTGNTIGECRKILLDAGAKDVLCATIAIVENK